MRKFLALALLIDLLLALIALSGDARATYRLSGGSGVAVALDSLPDWYYEGDQSGDEVGYALGAAGDVNGDGYDDVVVGAPHDSVTISREGVAYLFRGSYGGLESEPHWTMGSGQKGSLFGAAVGPAGDVNGDGYDDVIVGAYGYNGGLVKSGGAFVFHGSAGGLSTSPDWTFVAGEKDADIGVSVGTAGDVNGDGYDDVVVGARWYGPEGQGAAFVFHGSEWGLSTSPDWTVESDQAGAGFGTAVGTAGDVNGDGYDDVVVGAPYYDGTEANAGAAFLFYGSASGLGADAAWTAWGDQADAEFAVSAGTAGDVDGDGYSDVVVGAPLYDNGQVDEGAVFAFYGSDSGPGTRADWMAGSGQSGSGFGIAVGTAGDVDGDGHSDAVVGAYRYRRDQFDEGAAFLFHGSATGLHTTAAWTAEGNKAETWFGYAVGTAGDVHRDGHTDLVVGAPQYRQETDIRGRALAYHGPIEAMFRIYVPLVGRGTP